MGAGSANAYTYTCAKGADNASKAHPFQTPFFI